ncbi:hypothetical protein [Schlesneria sp.]
MRVLLRLSRKARVDHYKPHYMPSQCDMVTVDVGKRWVEETETS